PSAAVVAALPKWRNRALRPHQPQFGPTAQANYFANVAPSSPVRVRPSRQSLARAQAMPIRATRFPPAGWAPAPSPTAELGAWPLPKLWPEFQGSHPARLGPVRDLPQTGLPAPSAWSDFWLRRDIGLPPTVHTYRAAPQSGL